MLAGNVLMVSHFPSGTAYAWWLMEHFWRTIAELADERGHTAFLAFPKIDGLSETIRQAPITPVTLALPAGPVLPSAEVRRFLADNRIRSVYFTDTPYLNTQYLLFRLAGVREIIIHDHTAGDRPPVGGVAGAVKSIVNRLPWITADKVFCVSPHMRQRSLLNARLPESKVHVVQNGIPPVECYPDARASVGAELGLRDDEFLIVTTGRAHPYKRWDLVVRSAAELHSIAPTLRFRVLLVGDGHFMPKLKELVGELDVADHVTFCGFRSDAKRILCAADVAMHAAKGEGFSLSILEYMSAGLPTLVPSVPSVSQATTHGRDGFVYKDNDPADAARYLKELAENAPLRQQMSANARERVSEHYNLDQCTTAFVNSLAA